MVHRALSVLATLLLATLHSVEAGPTPAHYDQRQDGKYNVKIHLKDIKLISLGTISSDSLNMGEYDDSNYDYEDPPEPAEKPETSTSKAPALNSTISNTTKPESAALTSNPTKLESAALISNSPKPESAALISNQANPESAALTSNPTKLESAALTSNSPKPESAALISNQAKPESAALTSNQAKPESAALTSNPTKLESAALTSNPAKPESAALTSNPPNSNLTLDSNVTSSVAPTTPTPSTTPIGGNSSGRPARVQPSHVIRHRTTTTPRPTPYHPYSIISTTKRPSFPVKQGGMRKMRCRPGFYRDRGGRCRKLVRERERTETATATETS